MFEKTVLLLYTRKVHTFFMTRGMKSTHGLDYRVVYPDGTVQQCRDWEAVTRYILETPLDGVAVVVDQTEYHAPGQPPRTIHVRCQFGGILVSRGN